MEILREAYSNDKTNIDVDKDADKCTDVEKDTDKWAKLLEIDNDVHISDKGNKPCEQNASISNRKRNRGTYSHPM